MAKYSSGLVAESFWFVEFKEFIKLKCDGMSWDKIKELCIKDNILGTSKVNRARRMFGYLKRRVDALDPKLQELFLNVDLSTQKIISLIAIAKSNLLFYEFLYEEYRDKSVLGIKEINPSDVSIYFKEKQNQSEEISAWTEVTLKRLRSTYLNFLTDAGLLTLVDKKRIITPAILDRRLEDYLKTNSEIAMIKAITGVN